MGFLQWFESNPQTEESSGNQLSLLGESQNLPERQRVDGATVRKSFTKAIAEKGGNSKAQRDSTEALTEEVMGCSTKALYEGTGGKRKDRSTLPERAQEALMAGEVVAAHDLRGSSVEGSQVERNGKIVAVVRGAGRKVRQWMPW